MTQIKIKNIKVEYLYVISNLMHKYFILIFFSFTTYARYKESTCL